MSDQVLTQEIVSGYYCFNEKMVQSFGSESNNIATKW